MMKSPPDDTIDDLSQIIIPEGDVSPNSDLASFYRLFETSPGDCAAYLAAADELDGIGHARLAHAFRWMGFRFVWPHKRLFYSTYNSSVRGRRVPDAFRWAFYNRDSVGVIHHKIGETACFPRSKFRHHCVPALFMPGHQKVFGTHQQAAMWLADRLHDLNKMYSARPLE